MNEYTICVNCGSGILNITKDECPFCGLSVTKRSNIILRLINNNKPKARNTCEHCKFWDHYKDYESRQCLNEKVINLVDGGPEEEPYYHKDFGCIFWESKE